MINLILTSKAKFPVHRRLGLAPADNAEDVLREDACGGGQGESLFAAPVAAIGQTTGSNFITQRSLCPLQVKPGINCVLGSTGRFESAGLLRPSGCYSLVGLLLSCRAASTLQELLPVIHPARPQADVRARASPADGKVPDFGSCAAGVANTALRISRAAMNNAENKEETTS